MRVTIKEVAKMAGVSKATVSRVINDTKPVSQEIKEKVLKVVEETGYKPSAIARNLANRETKMIGVLIPDISNPFYGELVKGMVDAANIYNHNILLCNSFNEHNKEIEYLELLQDKQVDGIVFMASEITEEHINFFKYYTVPVVTVNRKFQTLKIPNVDINNFKAAYDIVEYLIKLNHEKVAIIRADLRDEIAGVERFEGYKHALADYDILFDERYVGVGDFKAESGYKAMEKLLALDEHPTAVFAVNDGMASGAIRCIIKHGLRVPEDISVVGFDDIPLAANFIPSITTVHQPIYEMGELAMKVIFNQLKGQEIGEEKLILPHEIVERESSMVNCKITEVVT